MNLYINDDLRGIEFINSTLQSEQDSLPATRVEKIMENLDHFLHNLKHHIKREKFTLLTEPLMPWIFEVLQNIDKTLDLYKDGRLIKIETVKQKIWDLQSAVENHPLSLLKEKQVLQNEIVSMALFFDFDAVDHNGGIAWALKQAIDQGVPFVTTRSMLLGIGIVGGNDFKVFDHLLDLQKKLYQIDPKWNIYQNGEIFVFLPKANFSGKTDSQILEAFDLCADGLLKKSSVSTIYEKAAVKCSIHDVIELFAEDAKVDSLFYAAGHGGPSNVAALKDEDYRIFLDFLERRRCKGLAIFSCSSGGKSSLLNIPEKPLENAGFLGQSRSLSFPVLVRSIGDFTAYCQQPAEENLKGFLDEFGSFVKGTQNMRQLRKKIKNLEGSKDKIFTNLIKFYPAYSAGIPGGFRAINECDNAYPLTYHSVKKAEIEPVLCKKGRTAKSCSIAIKNMSYLEISPLVVSVPIVFEGLNSVLLSITPGNGHHFIKDITLGPSFFTGSPLDFIKKTVDYHQMSHAEKGFFIGEIKGNGKTLRGVAFKISSSGAIGVGVDDLGCYLADDATKPKRITPFLHGLICREIMQTTVPEEKAVISMAGGQESEQEFTEAVVESNLFSTKFDKVFAIEDESLCGYMKNQPLMDQEAAVIFLLENKACKHAFDLFERLDLDPNMKKYNGNPLLFIAVQSNAGDMVRHLLKQGVNVNTTNSSGRPVLNQAIVEYAEACNKFDSGIVSKQEVGEREAILDLLLAEPTVKLEALNTLGWPAITHALEHYKAMEKLIGKGATVDCCRGNGRSLLSALVATEAWVDLELILTYNPDPNKGSPTALAQAFRANDPGLIKELLDRGGKPFMHDNNGRVPFVDAILWASAETVKVLLERSDCDPEIMPDSGMFPLLVAHIVGDKQKIQLLREKKFSFPFDELSKELEVYVKQILDRYLLEGDEEAIKELLSVDLVRQELVIGHFLEKSRHDMLKKLLDMGVIDDAILPRELLNWGGDNQNALCGKVSDCDAEVSGRGVLARSV